MIPLFGWRIWVTVLVAVALGWTHWKAYQLGGAAVQLAWTADKLAQAEQTLLLQLDADRRTADLLAQSSTFRKLKDAEIAKLHGTLAIALNGLRDRPARGGPADLPGNPATPSSCTGASLFRQDGEFLIRLASDADRQRLDLIECQSVYRSLSQP